MSAILSQGLEEKVLNSCDMAKGASAFLFQEEAPECLINSVEYLIVVGYAYIELRKECDKLFRHTEKTEKPNSGSICRDGSQS